MDRAPRSESATGGSASTQAVDADARQWRTRRATAIAVRSLVVLLPFAGALIAGRVAGHLMPRPDGPGRTVAWWGVVVGASSVVLLAVDRAARRLLPVAALYRLALVFPDKAPSRYRIALRTGTVRQLRDRLDAGGTLGDTPSEAAENLLVLVSALGKHDRITRGHSERVRAYSDLIAQEMGLPEADRQRLHWAALVHDVGKMAVRPEVLNKAGRPDDDEWQELRNHPAAAESMVEPLRPWLGDWVDAATQHHERIDGKGYPHGLAGTQISLAGRIVAVADAYDCMTSTRSYKKALPPEQARYELTRNSGTQFDPDAVRALLGVSVGRLHLAGGPLSWLAQLPGAREVVGVAGTSGASVSAGVAAAAVTIAGAVGGLVGPAPDEQPVSAARTAPIELVAGREEGRPAAVRGGDEAEAPAPEDTAVQDAESPVTPPPTRPGETPATTTTVARDPDAPTTTVRGATPTTTAGVATTAVPEEDPGPADDEPPPPPEPTTTTTTIANLAPLAVDDSVHVGLITTYTVTILVLGNDSDPDGQLSIPSLAIVDPPSRGSATVNGSAIIYTRTLLMPGTTFTYRICDNDGACSQATVTVTVAGL